MMVWCFESYFKREEMDEYVTINCTYNKPNQTQLSIAGIGIGTGIFFFINCDKNTRTAYCKEEIQGQ